jgi:predicted dehydrogenase
MVNVGVIGLGPQWESGYRAALERLESRIAVRAVYNAVESRAAQVAAASNADVSDGMRALLERPDVRAVLVLDTAWHHGLPFEFVLSSGKPAFLGVWPDLSPPRIEQFARRARDGSLTLIPAFPQRYMPATARLRELIATKIGRPRRIRIDTSCPADAALTSAAGGRGCEPVVHLFDWCRQVVRTSPAVARAAAGTGEADAVDGAREIDIEFRAPRGGEPCRAEIRLQVLEPGACGAGAESRAGTDPLAMRIEVEAERGRAVLDGAHTIQWWAAEHSAEESLTAERSEFEVMLDLFCRRVVGGLIPVADFGDIARGLALWAACEESLRTGGPVALKGREG